MDKMLYVVWAVCVFKNDDRAFAATRAALKPPSSPVFAGEHVSSNDWNLFPPLCRDKTDVTTAGV